MTQEEEEEEWLSEEISSEEELRILNGKTWVVIIMLEKFETLVKNGQMPSIESMLPNMTLDAIIAHQRKNGPVPKWLQMMAEQKNKKQWLKIK